MTDILERLDDVANTADYLPDREIARDAINEIARLRKKVEWFTHAVHTCHDECDRPLCAALREIERLRAALEPFAAVACVFDPDMIGGTMPHTGPWQSWPRTINGEMVMYELTVEHLRNARAALGEENSDE